MYVSRQNRRAFLRATALFPLCLLESGCGVFTRNLSPICTNQTPFNSADRALCIDVHGHIFNGSDLQVGKFLSRVIAKEARFKQVIDDLSDLIEDIAWSSAPTGAQELAQYPQLLGAIKACEPGAAASAAASLREVGYRTGVSTLQQALVRAQARRGQFRSNSVAAERIKRLPDTYEEYRSSRKKAFRTSGRDSRTEGVIAFILNNLQYRYVNAFSYFEDIGHGRGRSVDLLICHLVDYDVPIGMGQGTLTSFADQYSVMEEIAVLTNGRIHYFVPFDPMKEAIGGSLIPPFRSAQQAVLERGAIGIKLYPPMGFAPLGNAGLPSGTWDQPWLPESVRKDPTFGTKLDLALLSLYSWCEANGVPIMAHTNQSNGPSAEFQKFVHPKYWNLVISKFPNLRINFGHFGDTSPAENHGVSSLDYAKLMQSAPLPGGRVFADSGYFSEIFDQENHLEHVLRRLFAATEGSGSASLANRLMYGSDWEMILMEGRFSENYLSRFERVFAAISDGKHSQNFFGLNAAQFLGLSRGSPARERLDDFYRRRAVPTPIWAQKVDKLSKAIA